MAGKLSQAEILASHYQVDASALFQDAIRHIPTEGADQRAAALMMGAAAALEQARQARITNLLTVAMSLIPPVDISWAALQEATAELRIASPEG